VQYKIWQEQPVLYHAGMRRMFTALLKGVKLLIDAAKLRWIGFSHFTAGSWNATPSYMLINLSIRS